MANTNSRRKSYSHGCYPPHDRLYSHNTTPMSSPSWTEELFVDEVPGLVTRSRTTQPLRRAELPSTEPSDRNRPLPLDELLILPCYTSDEETEEYHLGNSSTAATTPSPVSRPGGARCCWQGCHANFGAAAYESVWENHIRSAHVGQEDEGGNRRSKLISCQWNGCTGKIRLRYIIKHIKDKHLEVVEDPASPDAESASESGISP